MARLTRQQCPARTLGPGRRTTAAHNRSCCKRRAGLRESAISEVEEGVASTDLVRSSVAIAFVALFIVACGGSKSFDTRYASASPTWSPDAKRIAFQHDTEGGWFSPVRLYVASADGTSVTKITDETALSPAWAPAGGRIVFSDSTDLILVNDDGSGREVIVKGDGLGQPAWSPDGRFLAFVKGQSLESELGGALYIVRADGTGRRRLARGFEAGNPAWSPDGRSIAFDDTRNAYYGIWLVNTRGGKPRRIVRGAGDPAWSPDGKRIAFSRGLEGIFAARPDGSGEQKLAITLPPGWPGPDGIAWSPDGKRIAFASAGDVYVALVAGGPSQPLIRRN